MIYVSPQVILFNTLITAACQIPPVYFFPYKLGRLPPQILLWELCACWPHASNSESSLCKYSCVSCNRKTDPVVQECLNPHNMKFNDILPTYRYISVNRRHSCHLMQAWTFTPQSFDGGWCRLSKNNPIRLQFTSEVMCVQLLVLGDLFLLNVPANNLWGVCINPPAIGWIHGILTIMWSSCCVDAVDLPMFKGGVLASETTLLIYSVPLKHIWTESNADLASSISACVAFMSLSISVAGFLLRLLWPFLQPSVVSS